MVMQTKLIMNRLSATLQWISTEHINMDLRFILGLMLSAKVLITVIIGASSSETYSEWSSWSTCSRSCGSGVSSRTSHCLLDGQCSKASRFQYRSCCVQECDTENADEEFRAQQCTKDKIKLDGEWTLHAENGTMDCSITCVNKLNQHALVHVNDGTPCTRSGEKGVCLSRLCVVLGCDGVLGSHKIVDKCLRCLSPTEEQAPCSAVQGEVRPSIDVSGSYGTVIVLELPAGATSITLSHPVTSGSGKLTLFSQTTNQLIESNSFSYNMTGDEEVVTILGPLSQSVSVKLVGVTDSSPYVYYGYYHVIGGAIQTMPPEQTHPHKNSFDTKGVEFYWDQENFGPCSISCGSGVAVALAVCRDAVYPDRIVDEAFCRGKERPAPLVSKCNTQQCPPRWVSGEWSGCVCSGTEKREVVCHQPTNESPVSAVTDKQCSHLPKPKSSRSCPTSSCQTRWRTGNWSQCVCGETRFRSLQCIEAHTKTPIDSIHCNDSERPSTEEMCPCQEKCKWGVQRWRKCSNRCGSGNQSGVLRCKNVITNRKVDESCCAGQVIPEEPVRECYGSRSCTPTWNATEKCIGQCCGQQYLEFECVATYNKLLVIFPPELCSGPPPQESCSTSECARWKIGPCLCMEDGSGRTRKVDCVRGQTPTYSDVCETCFGQESEVQDCEMQPPCTNPERCVDKVSDCKNVPSPCGQLHKELCCASCSNQQ